MSEHGASVTTAPGEPRQWNWTLLVLGLLALAGLAYANAVSHPFVYDDIQLVLKNPEIRSTSQIPGIVGFSDDGFRVRTRWTRNVLYSLEYAYAGANPTVFHATNIVLHALVGLLIFSLIASVTRNRWIGWWTAAVFLVHPINTEVVAHVSGRRGLLAAFFALSAMVLLERYTRHGGSWRWIVASFAIYLGVYSKELAIAAPVVFVVLDSFAHFRDDTSGGGVWSSLRDHLKRRSALYGGLALLTLALAFSVVFMSNMTHGLDGSPGIYDSEGGLGPVKRASLVGLSLRLLVAPIGQTVDYSFDALGFTTGGWVAMGIFNLLLLGLAATLVVRGVIHRTWIGAAGLWFLLFYLPHMGIIAWHEVFAERFVYLAGIGFCAGIAGVGVGLARRPGLRVPMIAAGLTVLALLTFATIQRNQAWGSSEALWESAVQRYPDSGRAHKALGDAYASDSRNREALDHYKEATRIRPGFLEAHVGQAIMHASLMDFGTALTQVNATLERWPRSAKALNLKGYIQQTMGNNDAAFESYRLAVQAEPSFADGYNNMARIYVENGDILTAVEMYEKALEINPAMVTAMRNLAVVYREAYKDDAMADFYDGQARQLMKSR